MEDIRAIRSQLGLTQIGFAEKLGLHQSTISRLETGEMEIDKRTRLAIRALVAESALHAPHEGPATAGADSPSSDVAHASIGGEPSLPSDGTGGAAFADPAGPSGRAPGAEEREPVAIRPETSAPGDLFAAEPMRGVA